MAYLISAIVSLGALSGIVKLMYAAVRPRTREIGTLRAIGWGNTGRGHQLWWSRPIRRVTF